MIIINKNFPKDLNAIIFDWGDTLMHDYRDKPGPMYLWDKVSAIEGIGSFLELSSKKYKLYVGSNSGESDTKMMIKALERGKIAHYFTDFFASTDMLYHKPDPLFFKTILKIINLPPEKVAMIGNDYQKDILAAKNVGLFTFYYNLNPLISENSRADVIFSRFQDLCKVFFNSYNYTK